jgi:hypothetical protein
MGHPKKQIVVSIGVGEAHLEMLLHGQALPYEPKGLEEMGLVQL